MNSGGNRGKILLMDDEEVIRLVVSEMIAHFGYQTEVAADGAEAIKMYQQAAASSDPFDVVILDLSVQRGMGGKETLQHLLKLDPNAKVILASGYLTDPVMANYPQYGVKGILSKPFVIEELGTVLNDVMAENQSTGESPNGM